MKWQVLLKDRFLMQGKYCLFPSQVLTMTFFFCIRGWKQRGTEGGSSPATLAGSAKNGKNAGGPFESGLQSRWLQLSMKVVSGYKHKLSPCPWLHVFKKWITEINFLPRDLKVSLHPRKEISQESELSHSSIITRPKSGDQWQIQVPRLRNHLHSSPQDC